MPQDLSFGPRYTGRSALVDDCAAEPGRAGLSLIEILLAIVLLAASTAIALPSIERMRVRASVQNAQHAVVSALELARATAMRYGRPAVLRIDSARDRVWIEADTTVAGDGTAVDTIGRFHLAEELNVNLESNRTALCFDGRGVGTTSTTCPLPGAAILLSRANRADTVLVSALGQVIP